MSWVRQNVLLILTVCSVLMGVALGVVCRSFRPSPQTIMMISFPGELLMNMLKLMILPLIVSSIISGLAQLDAKSSGRMGTLSIIYYFSTTIVAVMTGIALVLSIHPGDPTIKEDLGATSGGRNVSTIDTILDLLRNTFPENIVQATFQQVQTKYKLVRPRIVKNDSETLLLLANGTLDVLKPATEFTAGMNVLGIIVFSIAFGISLSQLGEEGSVMVQFFTAMDKVIMRLIMIIIWYSPVGIMCLIAGRILNVGDIGDTIRMLAMYMVTVVLGLLIHVLVTLPTIFFITTRKNPYTYMRGLLQAWLTAVGTASSSATLPLTFRCLEENLGIDKRVTRFVLPVGATINMDGTALYEAVAAIFIAQMNGVNLSFSQVITVSSTATLASIGAAAVPSAGLVTMLLVLTAVGLPVNDVSLIVAVDWLLDRLRTSVNVVGDAFGAGIVHHFCKKTLAKVDAEHLHLRNAHTDHETFLLQEESPQLSQMHQNGGYHALPQEETPRLH